MATWYAFFGISDNGFPIDRPYTAPSPTLRKNIRYNKDEIWSEINRILDEDKQRQFTPGQQIYYNAHYCISPYFFIDTETNLFLEEINISKRLSIPIASSIENSEYHHLVILSAISEEIDACNIVKKRKENGKKQI